MLARGLNPRGESLYGMEQGMGAFSQHRLTAVTLSLLCSALCCAATVASARAADPASIRPRANQQAKISVAPTVELNSGTPWGEPEVSLGQLVRNSAEASCRLPVEAAHACPVGPSLAADRSPVIPEADPVGAIALAGENGSGSTVHCDLCTVYCTSCDPQCHQVACDTTPCNCHD